MLKASFTLSRLFKPNNGFTAINMSPFQVNFCFSILLNPLEIILKLREIDVSQGGIIGGACVSFSAWAMKKRGPVLVSMFSPIGTVCSVFLSFITLGDTINIGRYTDTLYILKHERSILVNQNWNGTECITWMV